MMSNASGPAKPEIGDSQLDDAKEDDLLLKEFFSELREVDRDNEVNRIIWSFKINPFERLDLRFDATVEDVRKQYRKLSLMVHPDKCKHPQASDAFEILGQAQKELLDDEKRESLVFLLNHVREQIREERRKSTKYDNIIRLASVLHDDGRKGVEAEWEKTEEFHEKWRLKAREYLANTEWRRRKLSKRMKTEEERIEKEEKEDRKKAKKAKEHDQKWETTRETRVGTWRDYMKQSGKKSTGQLKPPKIKTNDEERLYVQRPVGEQFRPPPPKGAKKGK